MKLTRLAALVTLALVVMLSACQPLPHPFDEDRPPAALLTVPNNIDIAVGSFEGEPRATAAKLPAAIAKELLKRNIPASELTTSRSSYRLDGRIEERPDQPGKTLVAVFWRLRDPSGRIVSERSDRLSAPTRDWESGSDERVAQIAAAGAGGVAALVTDDSPKEQPGPGRTRLAIRKIAGAPGDGNNSLVVSLGAILKRRDIDLVDPAKGRPDLAVDAEIAVDPPKDGKQHVKIVWHVARAAGGEIGTVAQENDVPRGQLDGPWGDIAYSVAMAAEGGIMQLVDRGGPHRPGVNATIAARPAIGPDVGAATIPSPRSSSGQTPGPPVAGNLAAPEVNLPPVNVTPTPGSQPEPLATPDAPVVIPYRGVPIPRW